MVRKARPADDRESSDLLCWEQSGTPASEPESCPLLQSVVLLPLRYGRVEITPAGTDSGYPYQLASRPLGYRLLREGYLYVLDADIGELHEYMHEAGELSGHNEGKLEYPKAHTLYVAFSDIAWTDRKKAQVLDDPEERNALLQKIDLATASPSTGGKHLLTPAQAKLWVAEFAEEGIEQAPEGAHSQESEPYYWEGQPYFHKTRFGKLIKQQEIDDPSNCLCLVVQDDVGVMLDLAHHQDEVVGWIAEWAESGDTERDYMLGAYIESLTTLSDEVLAGAAASTGNEQLKALYDSTTESQRQTIYDYVQVRNEYRGPHPMGTEDYLREHHGDNPLVKSQLAMIDSLGSEKFETHRDAINQLNLRNFHLLNGASLGQRGINDLIDRPKMDTFMAAQRVKLSRWQALLKDITHDRVFLLTDARYHAATWYFDPEAESQVEAALDLQYACLKDICRSDYAAKQVLDWIEKHPQYTHPLFHTLPRVDQAADGGLVDAYANIAATGYSVVTKASEWILDIKAAETEKLPDIAKLSRDIQQKASSVGDTLNPAVSLGVARTLSKLYSGIDSQNIPPLDELFRDLPFFFKRRMLNAIDAGEAEFRVASQAEMATFRDNLTRMLALNERLEELNKAHELAKQTHGHRSDKARSLNSQFRATREEHRAVGKRVAAALSPVEEVETGLKLEPAETGRAGLTLIVAATKQQEIGSLIGHFRQGVGSAPRVNLMGDGLGVLVFVVQFWNFAITALEVSSQKPTERAYGQLFESMASATGAGFLAAQGLMDTAFGARASSLTNAWQGTSLKAVHIQMGKLHVLLGGPAYLFGAISAALSTREHWNNWQEAVHAGNQQAQAGAVFGMLGSGGLTTTASIGFGRTLGVGGAVLWAADDTAKGLAWATAGRSLSGLFARINVFGLVFTVLELGGTWLYNRYNLNERDKWLLSTPWSREPARIHNGSLADYESALAGLGSSVTLQPGANDDQLVLNCHSLPARALAESPESAPRYRVWLSAWRVHPARTNRFFGTAESWEHCTYEILTSLDIIEEVGHLQLAFTRPQPQMSKYRVLSRELALLVKLEALQPEGHYTESVYLLKDVPDSGYPVVPVQEASKGEVIWRRVTDPLMDMDIYL